MSGIRLFGVHRNWEDWLGIVFGVLIGFSPWLAGETHTTLVAWNAVIVGTLVLTLALLELVDLRRWEEVGEIALGLWLIASPLLFGYADEGVLRYWQFALGAGVVLLALIELWQDWELSDEQLARHGR